jgi:hypothetical protein
MFRQPSSIGHVQLGRWQMQGLGLLTLTGILVDVMYPDRTSVGLSIT